MSTPQYIKNAQNAYNSKFDLVQLRLPKGTKDRIRKLLDSPSIAAYCKDAVMSTLESDERTGNYPFQTSQNALGRSETEKKISSTPEQENDFYWDSGMLLDEFNGLKASEWDKEKHGRVIPRPPYSPDKDLEWDSGIEDWCEPLPFD